jgi:hypothetical protein
MMLAGTSQGDAVTRLVVTSSRSVLQSTMSPHLPLFTPLHLVQLFVDTIQVLELTVDEASKRRLRLRGASDN